MKPESPITPDSVRLSDAIAHDLNNTFGVIYGFSALASTSLRRLAQDLAETAPQATSQLLAILATVDNITRSAEEGRRIVAGQSLSVITSGQAGADNEADASSSPSSPDPDIRVDTRILVVDDSVAFLNLTGRVLRQAGYEVEPFTDPVEALRHFTIAPLDYDLVITDALMPVLTGTQLSKKLHAVRSDVPIVICTGSDDSMVRGGAPPEGIRAVVRKPYRPHELADVVREILAAA